jgi:tetratricopeptide (TPR) repeat protein
MKQLLLIVAFTVAAAGGARAQPAEPTAVATLPLARRLYEEGVDAVGKGRWSIAFDRFKASYEVAPRPQTLYNLAGAQGQTGRLVEAAENYRRFLRDTADGRYADLRSVATEQLELLDKQIAQLTLEVANIEPGDVIAIDDNELPQAVLRQAIPVNPGPHIARVQRGAKVLATRTLALAAGAAESVRIELPVKPLDLEVHRAADPPGVTATLPRSTPVTQGAGHRWLRSPWLWSGVAVVVAGGAASAYLLTRPDGVTVH